MIPIGRIIKLSWFEWRTITAAGLLLPISALSLKFLGFKRAQEMLCSAPEGLSVPVEKDQLQEALKIAHAVDLAAVHGLYKASCLKRSLVLCRFLRRRGIDCELRIGADLSEGELQAHAWVEHAGVVLNDSDDVADRFTALEPDSDRNV